MLRGAGVDQTEIAGGANSALIVKDGARVVVRALTLSTSSPTDIAVVLVGELPRATLVLEDCRVVRGPQAHSLGIWARRGSKTLLRRCIVTGASGGVRVDDGALRVESSTIEGSTQGLLPGGSRVRVRNSTIVGNGLYGIRTRGDPRKTRMTIRSSTISGNGGDAIFAFESKIRIASSILDGSCTYAENLISLGGNLFSACVPGEGRVDLDLLGADPLLGPLQDNGGPTPTMLPGVGSPAIDALDKMRFCGQPDQRGNPRGLPCDIGAVDTP